VKVLLKVIAVWLALFVLVPLLFLAWHALDIGRSTTSWADIVKIGAIVAALVAFIGLGTFAVQRLWHLQESGRWAAVACFVIILAFMLVLPVLTGTADVSVISMLYAGWPLFLLLSPPARRACELGRVDRQEEGAVER
jgi:hypothetical protein